MIPQHQRQTFEETDEALNEIDGLIAALDIIEDQIRLPDERTVEARAFRIIRPMLTDKMAEIWELRNREWQSIGGKSREEVLAELAKAKQEPADETA